MSDTSAVDRLKEAAGEAAATLVRSGMKVGLGTGSTIAYTIEAIGRMFQNGDIDDIVTVATSERTAIQARTLGLPVRDLSDVGALDITIDGADEVDPAMILVKGLGGALLREKIVASSSAEMIVVVDRNKLVARIGTRAPIPVETDPFGWKATQAKLARLGCEPRLRMASADVPFRTDGGHLVLDCHFPQGVDDAAALERAIHLIPGALECGLFVGIARRVIVGAEDQVLEMHLGGDLRPFA